MSLVICGDWGTSSLRLRLVETADLSVLSTVASDEGIGGSSGLLPLVLLRHITSLGSPDDVDVVLSGMASSNIGLLEVPYTPLPFSVDGSNLRSAWTMAGPHRCLVISGVCSLDDVMRGEETQLVGAFRGDGLYILPGTHSKHIVVRSGTAISFRTFMTGEFFALLSQHSLLSRSVANGEPFDAPAFAQGVLDGSREPLLNAVFRVRTNQLFERYTRYQNMDYLSGLLIGAELSAISVPPVIVGSASQTLLYATALEVLGFPPPVTVDGGEAAVRGQCAIWGRL